MTSKIEKCKVINVHLTEKDHRVKMSKIRLKWKPGDRARIARLAGVSRSMLCDVLKRRKRCSNIVAERLEIAAVYVGYNISRTDFSYNLETKNPLFG